MPGAEGRKAAAVRLTEEKQDNEINRGFPLKPCGCYGRHCGGSSNNHTDAWVLEFLFHFRDDVVDLMG